MECVSVQVTLEAVKSGFWSPAVDVGVRVIWCIPQHSICYNSMASWHCFNLLANVSQDPALRYLCFKDGE